jgi:thiol-disulfide isomerase/thioredoxin
VGAIVRPSTVVAVIFWAAAVAAPASALPAAGKPVTGIAGRDPVSGKYVSLAHWRGRPLVINVWASWCAGCIKEARDLRRFARAHPGALLGVDYGDSRTGARAFYRRFGLGHPSIFDPRGRIVAKLKAIGLPTTVFLDRRHVVVHAIAGAATLEQLEAGWRRARRAR